MKEQVSCGVIRDLLPLCADQVASPESRALVNEHLKTCEDCRNELDQLTRPISLPPEQNNRAEMKRWKKALNRRVGRNVVGCIALLALGLLVIFLPTLRDCFGVPAEKLEASSRRSSSAADCPLLAQAVNEDIGYLLFDKGNEYVKYDIYVNRPGFDFGYHFRESGSRPAEDGLYSLYAYQTGNSTLVYSLTGSGVVRVEKTIEDSAIPGTVYLVDPDQPWAVIFPHMPDSEKHAYLTAYNADGEVVPFTTSYVG